LQWLPELGIGYFPVTANPYDSDYWDKYRRYDETPCGESLTAMRIALVASHWPGLLVDIGIGGGRFVRERPLTLGFDINPLAKRWLNEKNWWVNPWAQTISSACFWDSLEHIADPTALLANVRRFAFVSAPIYHDADHVLTSKHYRKDEHFWYWTRSGIERFMQWFGFECIERNDMEQAAGREAIESFVFRRIR
jgi:hypothetical protein